MSTFLQQTVNALVLASVYALIGLGLNLSFGLTGLVNFAHGQFLILGGFIAYEIFRATDSFVAALLGATIAIAVLGVITERTLFRRTYGRPEAGFVASLGLLFVMGAAFVEIWGRDPHSIRPPVSGSVTVLGAIISLDRLTVVILGGLMLALVFAGLRWLPIGRRTRAASEDHTAALLCGFDPLQCGVVAFTVGAACAGFGGALLATAFPFTAYAGYGYVVKGFVVALIAGLGSIPGVAIGGLLLALAEVYGGAYLSSPWSAGFGYAVMLVILLVRPRGLFGSVRAA
ncbi:MAG: branched-chain amino acid transporter permease [Acidimicrobiales bacterium]|nr:branched-chain amino acid transporter permease [Acidimicrobiales bacterium]